MTSFLFTILLCFASLYSSVNPSLTQRSTSPSSSRNELTPMEFSSRIQEFLSLKYLAEQTSGGGLTPTELKLIRDKIHKSQNFLILFLKNSPPPKYLKILQQVAYEWGISRLELEGYLFKAEKDYKILRIKPDGPMLSTIRLSIIHEAHTQSIINQTKT